MATPITVSGDVAEKLQRLAQQRQQNIDALLESLLNQAWQQEQGTIDELAEPGEFGNAATPEMQAYIALHPMLKEKYLGQYVAIYRGKLIDHDPHHEALYKRIDAQYPDDFVWISLVEEEAIPTLAFRSPRIEWDEPA